MQADRGFESHPLRQVSDPGERTATATALLDELEGALLTFDSWSQVDDDGAVTAHVQVIGGATLWLHVGHDSDGIALRTRAGRSFQWGWREDEAPEQIRALLSGGAVVRTSYLGSRAVAGVLLIGGRPVARSGWPRRLVARLPTRDRPIAPTH